MPNRMPAHTDAQGRKALVAENFEQILDMFREGICITDIQGVVLHINASYTTVTGIRREDIVGRNVNDMVANGTIDIALNPEVLRLKEPVSRVQRVAGGRILMLEATPVFDAWKNVLLCFTVVRDITTMTELKEQISHQKDLLETLKHMASTYDGADYAALKPVIAGSAAMRELNKGLVDIADTDVTVLLLGETGVGKEVTAKRIHSLSSRKDKIFIKVDCGSIPEQLIETELFGYVPGSFSGGSKNGKVGLLEAADGGTLFLDEIGELPLQMQTRLLRFLQDRDVLRVGATAPNKVNVRVIAATNRNLEEAVAQGRFRSDLYYRIKVATFIIPPLRERKSDIFPLALAFLDYFNSKFRKKAVFTEPVKDLLLSYKWPGNVRELENIVQMAVVTCGGEEIAPTGLSIPIERAHSRGVRTEPPGIDLRNKSYDEVMTEMEAWMLQKALEQFGSVTAVAERFGVARSTIFRKMKKVEAAGLLQARAGAGKKGKRFQAGPNG